MSAQRAARQFQKTVEVFGLLLVDTARPALDEVGEVGLARVEAARAIELTGGGTCCFVGLEKLAAAVVLAFDHENWDCWDKFWLEICLNTITHSYLAVNKYNCGVVSNYNPLNFDSIFELIR